MNMELVKKYTDEAFAAFHEVHSSIPENLHPMIKIWGKKKVIEVADNRREWIYAYLKENHPELFTAE